MSNEGGKRRFNLTGWIAGVAGSVIAGVVIWALTADDGPLSQPEVPVSPFQIVDVQLSGGDTTYKVGQPIRYTATVVNAGEQAGNGCRFSASPQRVDVESNVAHATRAGEPFGLLPGETRELRRNVPIRHMDRAGPYRISFHLSCRLAGSGDLSSSASVRRLVQLRE